MKLTPSTRESKILRRARSEGQISKAEAQALARPPFFIRMSVNQQLDWYNRIERLLEKTRVARAHDRLNNGKYRHMQDNLDIVRGEIAHQRNTLQGFRHMNARLRENEEDAKKAMRKQSRKGTKVANDAVEKRIRKSLRQDARGKLRVAQGLTEKTAMRRFWEQTKKNSSWIGAARIARRGKIFR